MCNVLFEEMMMMMMMMMMMIFQAVGSRLGFTGSRV
jgi:hypothetical protein